MNQFVTNTKNVIRGKYHPEFLQNEVLADIFAHTAQTLPALYTIKIDNSLK